MDTIFAIAIKNLLRRPWRTVATIIAFAIAIALLFSIYLLAGSYKPQVSIQEQLGNIALHTKTQQGIFSKPSNANELFSIDTTNSVSRDSGITSTTPYLVMPAKIGKTAVDIVGLPEQFLTHIINSTEIGEGSSAPDQNKFVLAGSRAASRLNITSDSAIDVGDQKVGIVAVLASTNTLLDDVLIMPLASLQAITGGEDKLSGILITVHNTNDSDAIISRLSESLPNLSSQKLATTNNNSLPSSIQALRWTITIIVVLIGLLFIMTATMMSVYDRMKEIGTLMAIGISQKYILAMILLESLALSIAGAILGCIFGAILSQSITALAVHWFGAIQISVLGSLPYMVLSLALSALVGCLSALYPCWRIMKKNVATLIRYE